MWNSASFLDKLMKSCVSFLPSFCALQVRRKISSACSLDNPAIASAASNCIVTDGPLLETNWFTRHGSHNPHWSAAWTSLYQGYHMVCRRERPPTHVKWLETSVWISRHMTQVYRSRMKGQRWQKAYAFWCVRVSALMIAWSALTVKWSFFEWGCPDRTIRFSRSAMLRCPTMVIPQGMLVVQAHAFQTGAWSVMFPTSFMHHLHSVSQSHSLDFSKDMHCSQQPLKLDACDSSKNLYNLASWMMSLACP